MMIRTHRQKTRGVIFDLDETIIGSLGPYTEAFNAGTRLFGLEPVTDETIAHFLDEGLRLGQMLVVLFPAVFGEDGERQSCEEEIRRAYLELEPRKVVLKPGVKRVLQSLKERGIKIGIVTGRRTTGERKWLELRRLNIHQFVDAMVTGGEAPAKPAPDGLIKCIRELGLSAEECIFVGDSRVDVAAGKKAGVRTVAVHTGVAGKELLAEQGPDHVLADLNSLFSYLSELQKLEEE
jgi:phosphoglycolate phosphatase